MEVASRGERGTGERGERGVGWAPRGREGGRLACKPLLAWYLHAGDKRWKTYLDVPRVGRYLGTYVGKSLRYALRGFNC